MDISPGTRRRNRTLKMADMMNLALFVRIDFASGAKLGPGKIRLLELVRETGSISAAGRALDNMSYRRAWLLIEALNAMFDQPVVTTKLGGKGGGGAELTRLGHDLIDAYRRYEAAAAALAGEYFEGFNVVAPASGGEAASATYRVRLA